MDREDEATNKNEILPPAKTMDGPKGYIMLSEI